MLFYYDEKLKKYEDFFCWDDALTYLEDVYQKNGEISMLNSLIGFSWYYLFEGPCISRKYENDESRLAPAIWKKYINIGIQKAIEDPYYCFIAGYTLSMDGYYLGRSYEEMGTALMEKCIKVTDDMMLKSLACNFVQNTHSKSHISLKTGDAICLRLFSGNSLLDQYFHELYAI